MTIKHSLTTSTIGKEDHQAGVSSLCPVSDNDQHVFSSAACLFWVDTECETCRVCVTQSRVVS